MAGKHQIKVSSKAGRGKAHRSWRRKAETYYNNVVKKGKLVDSDLVLGSQKLSKSAKRKLNRAKIPEKEPEPFGRGLDISTAFTASMEEGNNGTDNAEGED